MKEVEAGVVLLAAAAFIGWLWLNGKGDTQLVKVRGAVQRTGTLRGSSSTSKNGPVATPSGSVAAGSGSGVLLG